MKAIPIKFSIQQILELTNQLPKEFKKQLIKKWSQELKKEPEAKPSSSNVTNVRIPFFNVLPENSHTPRHGSRCL